MKIITEIELRNKYRSDPFDIYNVNKNHKLTPAAVEFLNERKIKILNEEGQSFLGSQHKRIAESLYKGQSLHASEKPEEYTHLNGSKLVMKTNDRIVFRGKLDSLEADVILTILESEKYGDGALKGELFKILEFLRQMMRSDVKEEHLEFIDFNGWNDEEIRERSHYPNKYYGVGHFTPDPSQGIIMAKLNQLRTRFRELEIISLKAFFNPETNTSSRQDITMALNRMSSLIYILMCRHLEEVQFSNKI